MSKPKSEQTQRIEENLQDAWDNNFAGMTFSEMEAIFEDRDPCEFL